MLFASVLAFPQSHRSFQSGLLDQSGEIERCSGTPERLPVEAVRKLELRKYETQQLCERHENPDGKSDEGNRKLNGKVRLSSLAEN